MLFILALDRIYSVLQERADINGVTITSEDHITEVKVYGYADDTAT